MLDEDMGIGERWRAGKLELHCARPSEGGTKLRTGLKKLNRFNTDDAKLLIEAGMERRGQRDTGQLIQLSQTQAWVKGGRLKLESSLRHGVRSYWMKRAFPRVNEFRNLGSLRAAGIRAVRPLVAGVWRQGWRAKLQFLGTEWIPEAPSIAQMVSAGHADLDAALDSCGVLVARLHKLHFEHRDCFPRNFIFDPKGRAWVLDAWRGGITENLKRPGARDVDDFAARVRELGGDPAAFLSAYKRRLEQPDQAEAEPTATTSDSGSASS